MKMVDFFIKELDLRELAKKERQICLKNVLKYVMGLEKYSTIKKKLAKYNKGKQFLTTLKNLNQKDILYIKKLRKYAIEFDENIKISRRDKKWIQKFVNNLDWFINVSDYNFPLEEDILHNMYPSIFTTSCWLKSSLKNDHSIAVKDLVSELYIKTIETYRIYVCSCSESFNDKMLYSCIHNGLRTKKIDMIRTYNTDKNTVIRDSVPLGCIEHLQ